MKLYGPFRPRISPVAALFTFASSFVVAQEQEEKKLGWKDEAELAIVVTAGKGASENKLDKSPPSG